MRVGPVAFLLLVPLAWAALRAVMLWPEAGAETEREIAWADPLRPRAGAQGGPPVIRTDPTVGNNILRNLQPARAAFPREHRGKELISPQGNSHAMPQRQARQSDAHDPVPGIARPSLQKPDIDRFSLSFWTLVRGDLSPGLAAAGQLGGSQAGIRGRYALANGMHLAARLSGPIRASLGKEAAMAVDWRPSRSVPVTLTAERRIGLDRGGRDAFALGVFGGIDVVPLPLGLRLDGYGQAGVVGLKRRDAYIDGALRVERSLTAAGRVRVAVGAGLWGGAQPGAARLDIGPQLVVRMPIAAGSLRMGAEWRQRVAGSARPGSGPTLSLGADF